MKPKRKLVRSPLVLCLGVMLLASGLSGAPGSSRERLLMDFGWRFAFGHAADVEKDFNIGTSYFTYQAKAGYGDGPADPRFDDRTWRLLDLPHDWAAEAGFSPRGSHSHGYKAVGPGFPESSVGWYRKTFLIPAEDMGKRVFLEFDGVMRDARVWVNGFYCGHERSGYLGFAFDITEYLNYGGENVVVVRADVSIEEGWFYEGAGIYRHVWLTKTSPLHVPQHGTFVTSQINEGHAAVTAIVAVVNKYLTETEFQIEHKILDAGGRAVASSKTDMLKLSAFGQGEYTATLNVSNPQLWSLDEPNLYTLETSLLANGALVDVYTTSFGIRTIRWDAKLGFFLNGEHVKLKGTNNHQNHAGVGTAMPDQLIEYRIRKLKEMGSNAYRSAHYPPTPELLEACDRMGMLVINENRLMGVTDDILDHLKRLIIRDRNHPSVILWSIGNEEWAIEGSERGARIAETMQAFVKQYDTTRPVNYAQSGGWGQGISSVIEVMGFNYLRNGDTDAYHEKFPDTPSAGTEEGSTNTTRGVYFDNMEKQHLVAYDRHTPSGFFSIQHGWKHYARRGYAAGMFIWTGFDYRGEPTPFNWPSVSSYFGMMDLCGFPKDNVFYLKSWWGNEPVLHILPHWNWKGREGEEIDVWTYSNAEEVELFLNGRSLGRKTMQPNSHLAWMVAYEPGTLKAIGYNDGLENMVKEVITTGLPVSIHLTPDKMGIRGNQEDLAMVTVQLMDAAGLAVPDADHEIFFEISGPGKIIGVGNGDPISHEPDRYVESVRTLHFVGWKQMDASRVDVAKAVMPDYDVTGWGKGFPDNGLPPGSVSAAIVFCSEFILEQADLTGSISWMYRSIGTNQSVYVNGTRVGESLPDRQRDVAFALDSSVLKEGINTVAIVASPFVKAHQWDQVNTSPGAIQVVIPAQQWRRKIFNGLAQVIVQSTGEAGDIVLTALSAGLKEGVTVIRAAHPERRPYIW